MTIFRNQTYLQKHRFLPRQIATPPAADLGMLVVIPAHNEPSLLPTLESLEQVDSPPVGVEVIVMFNAGVHHNVAIHHQNERSLEEAKQWTTEEERRWTYHFLLNNELPKKHAGVGLARKIGLDEAVDRLEQVERPEGLLVWLDADSLVQPNYLTAIWEAFQQQPKREAASLDFAHPVAGEEHPAEVYAGIIRYELFLRYYIEGLRLAGYPYAFHTIGSSMVVRSSAYQKYGGMNRRKAGEDFYFLHKFIPQGQFAETHTTTVIPSPRPSDRVPFGTGKAIGDWLAGEQLAYPTYALATFQELRTFLNQVPQLYTEAPRELPPAIRAYLKAEGFTQKLAEFRKHVSSQDAFVKRLYQWFDGLKVLKYVHFARDQFFGETEVLTAARALLQEVGEVPAEDPVKLLEQYRVRQSR
ncbi:MAG: glycosyltransferase family A protein [Bacteroidota bacterium]